MPSCCCWYTVFCSKILERMNLYKEIFAFQFSNENLDNPCWVLIFMWVGKSADWYFLHCLPWCAKSILPASRRDGSLFHGQMHEIRVGRRVISLSIHAANALAVGIYEGHSASDSQSYTMFLAWATHLGNDKITDLRMLNAQMHNLRMLLSPFC